MKREDFKHCVRSLERVSLGVMQKIQQGDVVRLDYQPGTGTRYDVMFVPLKGFNVSGTGDKEPGGSQYWLVSLLNLSYRCYPCTQGAHWSYLAEKLGVSEVTARALEELLNFVLDGVDAVGWPEEPGEAP